MNKDCAGQCFGSHKPTDPACNCKSTLDVCYVCGGDNSACAGCDGIPYSSLVYDYCGVCGGDSTTCCYSMDSTLYVGLHAYTAVPSYVRAVTGQVIIFAGVDETLGTDHTILVMPSPPLQGQTRVLQVTAGNEEAITFGKIGNYTFYSQFHTILRGTIEVYGFNHNTTNSHQGGCGLSSSLVTPPIILVGPKSSASSHSSFLLVVLHWVSTLGSIVAWVLNL